MYILKYFDKRDIMFLPKGISKVKAIQYIVGNSYTMSSWEPNDRDEIINRFLLRESVVSTGIAEGVAIPHIYIDGASFPDFSEAIFLFGCSRTGVEWEVMDGKLCHFIAMLIVEQSVAMRLISNFTNILYESRNILSKIESLVTREELHDLIIESFIVEWNRL